MNTELRIREEGGRTVCLTSPASWGMGLSLMFFLGAILWLVGKPVVDEWPTVSGRRLAELLAFMSVMTAFVGIGVYAGLGVKRLILDEEGLSYSVWILCLPVWSCHIARSEITSATCVRVEGASEENGYYTLEVRSARRCRRFFSLNFNDELKRVARKINS